MRVCPKCGYIDNPNWQQCRFHQYLVFMRYSTFQMDYPELASQFRNGTNEIEDENYIYRLTKTKLYVKRKEKLEPQFYPRFEGHKAHADMSFLTRKHNLLRSGKQTKLLEATQK